MLYRLKNYLNYRRFRSWTRSITQTPPIPCDPGAGCALHTMLSRNDVPLYLVAIKSFLRFYQEVGVVVHSDGSLNGHDVHLLRSHLPGCRVVDAKEADAHAASVLPAGSLLERWRRHDPCYRRLIDTELLSETPKRIILDSDLLVLRPPEQIIQWIERGDVPFVMGQEPVAAPAPGTPSRHVQDDFKLQLDALSAAVGASNQFLDGGTGGCYGVSGNELSLERCRGVLQASLDLGLFMQQWGSDQCVILFLLAQAGASRLDGERYRNFGPADAGRLEQAALVHFFGTHRFYKDIYSRLAAQVVKDLLHQPALCPAS